MRWLIAALLLLAVAVGVASLLQHDPGYLYLELGQWVVETSVAFALAALVLAFAAVYLALRLVARALRTPRALRSGAAGAARRSTCK